MQIGKRHLILAFFLTATSMFLGELQIGLILSGRAETFEPEMLVPILLFVNGMYFFVSGLKKYGQEFDEEAR